MAIKRQGRFYSQERLSVPSIRAIESSVSADFDSVLRDMIAGSSTSYVLSGFKVNIGVSTFSQSADNLTLNTLNGSLLNTTGIESGTLLKVTGFSAEALNSANARVSGAFIAGSTNYISINYVRKADTSTDTVYFYDKNSETEFSKLLPVSTLLDYQIVINTTGFGVNVPIAIVQTNSGNVPTQITDSRNMLFRLGTGGLTPDAFHSFPWLSGRTEPGTITTSSGSDVFTGADKDITIFKDWMDAVMTSIKEVKGSPYWFSTGSGGGSSSGLSLMTVNDDANLSTWHGAGTFTHSVTTVGQLISSTTFTIRNMVTDATVVVDSFTKSMADGDVLFLNLTRYSDITGNVTIVPTGVLPGALVGQNNLVIKAGSVGQFVSLTNGAPYGDWVKSKNDNPRYFRQVTNFYDAAGALTNSVNATYLLLDSSYTIAGSSTGTQQIHYDKGFYGQSEIISTSRVDILNTYQLQNIYWLAYRNDTFLHLRNRDRLIQGEIRSVDENTSLNLLNFIGSSSESLTYPVYSATVSVGAITTSSQVNYGGLSTDDLTIRASRLSTAMANKAQDKNITLIGGGTVANSAGLLSWNASVTIFINGPGLGTSNYIDPGSVSLSTPNSSAYITIERNSISSLIVSVTTNDNLPLNENVYVIARRSINSDLFVGVGGLSFLIIDGTNSTTGFTPSPFTSLGLANIHKWKQEIPIGSINGINTSFTLLGMPHSVTSTMLFRNGLFQTYGIDYSITNTVNIKFNTPPNVSDEVVMNYAIGNTVPYLYVQSFTNISTTNSNTISFSPSPSCSYTGGVAVFLNGLLRSANIDYTASSSGINFAFNLSLSSIVSCFYTGVNDNEIAEQSIPPQTVTSGRTIYTYFKDINHPNSTLVTIDGVSQFPINNIYGLTSSQINIVDFRTLNPQTIEVNSSSLTNNTIINIWSK